MKRGNTAANMHRMNVVVAKAEAATGRNVSMSYKSINFCSFFVIGQTYVV
jgi:hypothetical protein